MSRPRSRLTPLLAAVLVASSIVVPLPLAGAQGMVRLVVSFRASASAAAADRGAIAHGGRIVERIPQLNVRVVELPAAAVAAARAGWASDREVTLVEPDGLVRVDWSPTDPLWGYQWEQRQVRQPLAWDMTRGSNRTVVAVIDTGVQLDHPDLAGQLVAGRDFVNRDRNPTDDNGHGTAVAGVIAAAASNGIGVAGGCPRCRVMPVKTLSAEGTGYWTVAARGIIWAADHGADVINLSFGGPTGGSTLYNAIAYARSRGAVVIASAGNNGSTKAFYPGAYDNVVSVAATTDLDLRFSWSNYSATWVDLAAPGCTYATIMWDAYHSFCGTSAAAPVVSSVAALVKSKVPGLARSRIEAILRASTVATPYAISQYGRIDAFAAVFRAVNGIAPPITRLTPASPYLAAGTRLTLLAGDHVGYRFDPSGAIIRARLLTIDADGGVEIKKRQRIPGRSGYWFYVTSGSLDRYWVKESSRAFLAPVATPTPTPSGSPAPTPTPAATATPVPVPAELFPSTPRLDPALTVLFKAGTYTGYRLTTAGAVIGTKVLGLAWPSRANTSKVGRPPGRAGTWFFIVNGGLAGYWVRSSMDVKLRNGPLPSPSSTTRLLPMEPLLSPAQRVRFLAGDHVGLRLATDGTILGRRLLTLDRTSWASAVKRMKVPNRDGWWLYIVDGGLAGYWIRERGARYLLP